jgi:hypothetical protein
MSDETVVYTVLFTFENWDKSSQFQHWPEICEKRERGWNWRMVDREHQVMVYNLTAFEYYCIRTILRNRKMPYQLRRVS